MVADGTVFVAERFLGITNEDGSRNTAVAFMVPLAGSDNQVQAEPSGTGSLTDGNVVGYRAQTLSADNGVLDIGMYDLGQETEAEAVIPLVSFLEEAGLIRFTGPVENGAVFYRYDGHTEQEVARIIVTLEDSGKVCAETPLHFQRFPVQGTPGTVVSLQEFKKERR